MHRKRQIRVDDLTRLLSYILGHRPDEFGLAPEPEGFISYKELLWAVHEESGWGYVKEADIREVLMGEGRTLFDYDESRIRAVDRRWVIETAFGENLPKILYTAVRKRAHGHAMEKGLVSERYLVLSPDPEFALKIGRRKDPEAVALEILTSMALERGGSFLFLGDVYLSKEIPAGCITGPPVREEAAPGRKIEKEEKERPGRRESDFMPGSFLLDLQRDPAPHRAGKGKRAKSWKEDARKVRKWKRK